MEQTHLLSDRRMIGHHEDEMMDIYEVRDFYERARTKDAQTIADRDRQIRDLRDALDTTRSHTGGLLDNGRILNMAIAALRTEGHKTLAAEIECLRESQQAALSTNPETA